jgi:uncharacterized membrane protein YcjF (UPF0283 family)
MLAYLLSMAPFFAALTCVGVVACVLLLCAAVGLEDNQVDTNALHSAFDWCVIATCFLGACMLVFGTLAIGDELLAWIRGGLH